MATSYVNETVTDDAPVAYVLLDRNRVTYALSDINKVGAKKNYTSDLDLLYFPN